MLRFTRAQRRYQYQGWQDEKNGRQKTIRDGVESVIEFLDNVSAGDCVFCASQLLFIWRG